jgi:hypothetical protein
MPTKVMKARLFLKPTRKANGLAAISPNVSQDLLANELWRGVYGTLLTTTTKAWNGLDIKEYTSQPQLNANAAIAIRPGGND